MARFMIDTLDFCIIRIDIGNLRFSLYDQIMSAVPPAIFHYSIAKQEIFL